MIKRSVFDSHGHQHTTVILVSGNVGEEMWVESCNIHGSCDALQELCMKNVTKHQNRQRTDAVLSLVHWKLNPSLGPVLSSVVQILYDTNPLTQNIASCNMATLMHVYINKVRIKKFPVLLTGGCAYAFSSYETKLFKCCQRSSLLPWHHHSPDNASLDSNELLIEWKQVWAISEQILFGCLFAIWESVAVRICEWLRRMGVGEELNVFFVCCSPLKLLCSFSEGTFPVWEPDLKSMTLCPVLSWSLDLQPPHTL